MSRRKSEVVPVTSELNEPDYRALLDVALSEARLGLAEGGVPIGAALFDSSAQLVGSGHNRQVQDGDLSIHAETDAFRRAGPQARYRDKILVTTLAPCWYCSGLVRHFQIGTVVMGESVNFPGDGLDGLRDDGIRVVDLESAECVELLASYIQAHPEVWTRGREDDSPRLERG
jgi:cytosine/creatinine deaminase